MLAEKRKTNKLSVKSIKKTKKKSRVRTEMTSWGMVSVLIYNLDTESKKCLSDNVTFDQKLICKNTAGKGNI